MTEFTATRGDVWLVNLDPTRGREQAKCRPCVVISPELFNQGPSELVVILPITSTFRQLSWFVQLDPPEGGLVQRSYIMCNQLRTVSINRFQGSRLGVISSITMKHVENRLRILLVL
jgi:mRNA interferase MazF